MDILQGLGGITAAVRHFAERIPVTDHKKTPRPGVYRAGARHTGCENGMQVLIRNWLGCELAYTAPEGGCE